MLNREQLEKLYAEKMKEWLATQDLFLQTHITDNDIKRLKLCEARLEKEVRELKRQIADYK